MPGGLPAVPKVVRLDVHMAYGTNPNAQVREFFQYGGALSVADAQTWLTAIRTGWNGNMVAQLSTALATVLFELTDLSSNSAPQVIDSTGAVGTDANAGTPAGTAFVFHKHINRRYRGGKPRLYMPGCTVERLTSPDTWSGAWMNSFLADYVAFIAAAIAGVPAAAAPASHVNVSYFAGFTNHTYPSGRVKPIPTPRVSPLIDQIVSVSALNQVASQRRRNQTV